MSKMAANPQDHDGKITANYDSEGRRGCDECPPDHDHGSCCCEDLTTSDDQRSALNHEQRPHVIYASESSGPAACARVTSQLLISLHDKLYDAAGVVDGAADNAYSVTVAAEQNYHDDGRDAEFSTNTSTSTSTSAVVAGAAGARLAATAAKDSTIPSHEAAKKPPTAAARLYKWCGCGASSACSHSFHTKTTSINNNNNNYVANTPHHHQRHISQYLPHDHLPYITAAPAKAPPPYPPPSLRCSFPYHPLSRHPHCHHPSQHEQGWRMDEGILMKPVTSDFNGGANISSADNIARELAKLKAQILGHPLYEQLLAAHVDCLHVATPVDHLPAIQSQLASAHHVAARYSTLDRHDIAPLSEREKEQLDRFMENYVKLLHSFNEQLREHVRVQAMEAIVSCWELEQAFTSLTVFGSTGVLLGDTQSGETMSDDEDESINPRGIRNIRYNLVFLKGLDNLGLGPLIPTELERTLMDKVRQELKSKLKQGYKNKIADVREEILRKRRAGKLPSETTSILKKWWNAHSKWPYPTEEEKARLVQETGLELKQINNWFINQRKRNWHNHAMTTTPSFHKNETSMVGGATQTSNVSLTLSCDSERLQSEEDNNFHVVGKYSKNL